MHTKKKVVRDRKTELVVKDTEYIRSNYIVQEHSMIGAETEDIGSKI